MRGDRERLLDILEAIERIQNRTTDGREAFDADELIQTWVVYHLQILGEAARAISTAFRESHPELPWAGITGMRNILVHHYFDVDTEIVWSVVEKDLPDLKAKLLEILDQDQF